MDLRTQDFVAGNASVKRGWWKGLRNWKQQSSDTAQDGFTDTGFCGRKYICKKRVVERTAELE